MTITPKRTQPGISAAKQDCLLQPSSQLHAPRYEEAVKRARATDR